MILVSALLLVQSPRIKIRLEAEQGVLSGPHIASEGSGYSGAGYATGFSHGDDWVTWHYPADHAGIYDVLVGYRAGGPKGFELKAAGHGQSGMFAATGDRFGTAWAGKVELQKGENEISIGKGWGYYDVDFLELSPSGPYPRPHRPPLRLSDPKASASARNLMKRLISEYGRRTFSGQYEADDTNFVAEKLKVFPAIFGGDLMEYSPSRIPYGSDAHSAVEQMIARARLGSIVTISWHWNAPSGLLDRKYKTADGVEIDASWYKGFYKNATTFDVDKAFANKDSEEYRLLVRDIDAIAIQLGKFAERDIPVLWRPLHEAEGGWFWWGAKGPEPCKQLWRLLRERLMEKHHLHNLIWVWNSVDPAWYPGDDQVDIVAVDRYPADRTDPLSSDWESLQKRFDGRKLLAVAEFPGAVDVERMHRIGADWAYFVSWVGNLGARGADPELLKRTYGSPRTVNRPVLQGRVGG